MKSWIDVVTENIFYRHAGSKVFFKHLLNVNDPFIFVFLIVTLHYSFLLAAIIKSDFTFFEFCTSCHNSCPL